MELRGYQNKLVSYCLQCFNKKNNVTIFMPIGLGKSTVALTLACRIEEKYSEKEVFIICTKREQLETIRHGYYAHYKKVTSNIFICMENEFRKEYAFRSRQKGIILIDSTPAFRDYLEKECSDIVCVSFSQGPYKYNVEERIINGETKISIEKRSKKTNYGNIMPGIYAIPTNEIIDIRDIIKASNQEVENIKKLIDKQNDLFIPLDMFNDTGTDYYIKTKEIDEITEKIEKLENELKELRASRQNDK